MADDKVSDCGRFGFCVCTPWQGHGGCLASVFHTSVSLLPAVRTVRKCQCNLISSASSLSVAVTYR